MTLAFLSGSTSGGLDSVKVVTDFLFNNFSQLVSTISTTPILLIPIGIFVCGAIIGLAKRLIGT